jgi:hypothetical protein
LPRQTHVEAVTVTDENGNITEINYYIPDGYAYYRKLDSQYVPQNMLPNHLKGRRILVRCIPYTQVDESEISIEKRNSKKIGRYDLSDNVFGSSNRNKNSDYEPPKLKKRKKNKYDDDPNADRRG